MSKNERQPSESEEESRASLERELCNSFPLFTEVVFRKSFDVFHAGEHVRKVCEFLQENPKTVRIGPKDHFKCIPLDEKIIMSSGDETEAGKLSVGDFVRTKSGSGKILRIERTGKKDCVEIAFEGGIRIRCSEDHLVLTDSGFIEAGKIRNGMRAAQIERLDIEGHKQASDDEIRLLAFLIADGSMSCGSRFTKKERDVRDKILGICGQLGFDVHKEREGTFYFSGAAQWLRRFGMHRIKSRAKKIPDAVMSAPEHQVKKFIEMIWSCDGSVSVKHLEKSLGISYCSTSYELERQLKILLLRFGIQSYITKCSQIYGGKNYDFFQLAIAGARSAKLFAETFNLQSERKNANLRIVLKECERRLEKIRYSKTAPIKDGIRWIKIKEIRKMGELECLDFEVEGEHNYLINSVVVHNSSSLYAWLMWQIWKSRLEGGFGCFYFSYDKTMAFNHLSKLKALIKSNPWFGELVDFKSMAEGLLNFAWQGTQEHCIIKPKGILCLRGDQEVLTSEGDRKISDVKIGDFVISKDGRLHKVLNALNRESNEDLVQIKVRNLVDPIVCSKEHKIFAIKNPKCRQKGGRSLCFQFCARRKKHCRFKEYPELKWIEAGNLEKGDIVVFPKRRKSTSPYSKDVLRLFGYYLAEGCLNFKVDRKGRKRGGRVRWIINSGERGIMKDLTEIVRKYFSGSVSKWNKGSHCFELTTINTKLCKILEKEFGHGAKTKKIPLWMESLEFDYFWEFLKGYWLGDGYKNSPAFSICSANKGILRSIQRALFNHDISSSIIKFDSCKEKNLKAFRLESRSEKILRAAGKKADAKSKALRAWFDGNYCYLPVKEVSKISYNGPVYDITVEGEHNYLANSIIVSNSFKRGIHEKMILVDDPFQDSANQLDPVIAKKVSNIFKTQIMDMPLEGGYLHCVLTPQTKDDFCFDRNAMMRIKVLPQPAIRIENGQEVALWPEHMTLKELYLRREERGEKIFMQEYMCLGEGTKIITKTGFKRIEDIKVGDEVLGDGKFVKVLCKFNTEAKELVRLKINRSENNIIEATENHPFLVVKQKGKMEGTKGFYNFPEKTGTERVWKNAADLKRGDIVCFPRLTRDNEEKIKISDEALELAGWYVSEGFSADYRRIDACSWMMGISQADAGVRERIRELIKKVWDHEAGISKTEVVVSTSEIVRYYHCFFGGFAEGKKLPDWFFDLTERQFNIFFEALFKGDGHRDFQRRKYVYATKSEILAMQLIVLLRKFGKHVSLNRGQKGMFYLLWHEKPMRTWMDDDYFYVRILRAERICGNFKTFNMSTEDQTFCTNLCLVHNCQPSFEANAFWKREDVEEMTDLSLSNYHELKTDNIVSAGWDVGKFRHPAHIAIFEKVGDIWFQRYQEFMDGWDYSAQVEHVNDLTARFGIDFGWFDATGREIESFRENKTLNPVWQPLIFKTETKWRMVNNMEALRSQKRIKLIASDRQRNQLLVVNNSLQAIETIEGHGEPFFTMAMALQGHLEIRKEPVRTIGIIPRKNPSPFRRYLRG